MTPRQKECLDYVSAHVAEFGFSPTYEEICGKLQLASRSNVVRMVNELVRQGHLRRDPGKARGLLLATASPLDGVSSADLRAELKRRGEQL